MRKIFIILSLFVIFLTGCDKETEKPINSKEEGSAVVFDRGNSAKVIQESLECDISKAEAIVRKVGFAKIKGAIKAELVEDDTFDDFQVVLEIESEDHRIYRIYMGDDYGVEMIKDMETGEYVFAIIK